MKINSAILVLQYIVTAGLLRIISGADMTPLVRSLEQLEMSINSLSMQVTMMSDSLREQSQKAITLHTRQGNILFCFIKKNIIMIK